MRPKKIEDRGWRIAKAGARTRSAAVLCLLPSILSAGFTAPARAADPKPTNDYLLHLPGIAGYHWVDKQMLLGLREGGVRGTIDVRDWPGDDAGLGALFGRQRNEREAQAVADTITARAREHPDARIVLTAHSGGTGILVWALEKLPADVRVDTVLLLAPALSPDYDLSKALKHVRGKMYSFTSELDAFVLGAGTSTFGTIDGVKCDAAGRWGFEMPDTADARQYEKLVPMPYKAEWMRDGNLGEHIGALSRRFSRNTLAPLVTGMPTTRPVQQARESAQPSKPADRRRWDGGNRATALDPARQTKSDRADR